MSVEEKLRFAIGILVVLRGSAICTVEGALPSLYVRVLVHNDEKSLVHALRSLVSALTNDYWSDCTGIPLLYETAYDF
jgi:hypothetical protein